MKEVAYTIEVLPASLRGDVSDLLENVFTKEQNIPRNLHFPECEDQLWWCVKIADVIVGTAALWKVGAHWHWGRLALAEEMRGKGLGKKLVVHSLNECFNRGVDALKIDARAITVSILKKLGGEVLGEPVYFYDIPITPMLLHKSKFKIEQ